MGTTTLPSIPLCEPDLTGQEAAYLQEAIRSGFVSSVGPFVERFEESLRQRLGADHAVACASGTAALHLALIAAGVGPGDVVLCSDCTFIASANPIRYCGAEVAFIDSEAQSWNMDPTLLGQAIDDLRAAGRVPKAVIVVHLYGVPADLAGILAVCAAQDIAVIEDATEALGAGYVSDHPQTPVAGRQVGCVGRIGCFSFNGNKMITTGGGGMVVTGDESLARRMRHLSTQAKLPGIGYEHDAVGFNYRLTNIAAAVGCAQLERLDDFLQGKQSITRRYRQALPDWRWQEALPGSYANHWLPTALVPDRDRRLEALHAAGVLARPAWRPLHRQAPYQDAAHWSRGIADGLDRDGLSLPASPQLSEAQLDRIIAACREELD